MACTGSPCFNSTTVRLKEKGGNNPCESRQFQFHYGTVKSRLIQICKTITIKRLVSWYCPISGYKNRRPVKVRKLLYFDDDLTVN